MHINDFIAQNKSQFSIIEKKNPFNSKIKLFLIGFLDIFLFFLPKKKIYKLFSFDEVKEPENLLFILNLNLFAEKKWNFVSSTTCIDILDNVKSKKFYILSRDCGFFVHLFYIKYLKARTKHYITLMQNFITTFSDVVENLNNLQNKETSSENELHNLDVFKQDPNFLDNYLNKFFN